MVRATIRAAASAMAGSLLLGGCTAVPEPPRSYDSGQVELLTGGTRGVYYVFGAELARVFEEDVPGSRVTAVPTSGSVRNLRELAGRPGTFAFSSLDAADEAIHGSGPFDEPLDLTAVARVYDDFYHVVVREGSGIDELHDLRGRSVSLGSEGSGTELIARRLLDVVGIDPDTEMDAQRLGINESVEALADGSVDAFMWSGGLPTSGVTDLAKEIDIRLLSLDDEAADMRQKWGGVYRAGVIPPDVYGFESPVPTLAVPNVIVTTTDTSEDLVFDLTRVMFSRRGDISRTVPLAGALDRRSAIFTSPVPLHDGALRYYRATQP